MPTLRQDLPGPFAQDWARQLASADEIVRRLQNQEGVILADQVGMGKTFTALAVAVKEVTRTPKMGQVVVFVPAKVATKWHNEWQKFKDLLVLNGDEIRCSEPKRRGEEFLKALDDPPSRRAHLLIVTHEALTQNLNDKFIQLALMYYAVKNRRGADELRERIARWSKGSSGLLRDSSMKPKYVQALLETSPADWRDLWLSLTGEDLEDDPVPAHLESVSGELSLDGLFHVLAALPKRSSAGISTRLKDARARLGDATQSVWKQVLAFSQTRLPLIIVDEAHALKNDRTRVSRLFTPLPDENEDGALDGVFDRMLFLTATPFELGHSELIRVLSRFDAVRSDRTLPHQPLMDRLAHLAERLRVAQETAITLDTSWSRLTMEELAEFTDWGVDSSPPKNSTAAVKRTWRDAQECVKARQRMHESLHAWIIRHQRQGRRTYHPGAAIQPHHEGQHPEGLEVPDSAALAFLLAARAQTVAAEDRGGSGRPLFAYGIASSYETFLRLEDGSEILIDSDDESSSEADDLAISTSVVSSGSRDSVGWYRKEIRRLLNTEEMRDEHPKVRATSSRALDLWSQGEKCLIFCWYIRTTQRLTDTIHRDIENRIKATAAEQLRVHSDDVAHHLDQLSDHLLKSGTRNYRTIRDRIIEVLAQVNDLDRANRDLVSRVAIRHLRTPDYIVRYSHLASDMGPEDIIRGIHGENPAGVNVARRWVDFAQRLAEMVPDERDRTLTALLGEHHDDVVEAGQSRSRGSKLASVRRAYGQTDRSDRERLITVFNTPFAPDVLVASSVMGEGIDLHQECRHVIHHDLAWNPSKLEQRTGRLDRIGALAERVGQPIHVFEPYLSGTHDEKMFLVVKDRANWFDIVMGQPDAMTEEESDGMEKRVPLASAIARNLTMDLSVWGK